MKTYLHVAVFSILLLILLILFRWERIENDEALSRTTSDSTGEGPTGYPSDSLLVDNKANVELGKRDENDGSLSKVNRILEIARLSNVDIDFYGQVVDELDRPVANAVVVAGYNRGTYSTSRGEREVTTDINGLFRLEGYGHGLSIVDVRREDLSKFTATIPTGNGLYRTPTLILNGSHFQDSTNPGTSPTNPMKIIVSVVEEFGDVEYGSMSRSGSITVDAGKNSNQAFGLEFVCERETLTDDPWYEVGTWRAVLRTVGGGGFQRANSTYLNQAPENGYEIIEIGVGYEVGGQDYKKRHSFQSHDVFYYYSAGNNTYGVFRLNKFTPNYSDKTCRVHFNFIKRNKENGRNLTLRRHEEASFTR